MKVLLINPPPKRVLEAGDAPPYPHLGLAYIGSYLLQQKADVACIDGRFERLSLDRLRERITDHHPDIVGITAMTHSIVDAHDVARMVKETLPQATTVIGGPHTTALPRKTLEEFPSFDIGVPGEGELVMHSLVQALEGGGPLEDVSGILYRRDGQVWASGPDPRPVDVDQLPFPAWHLFPQARLYPIFTQRGCPFPCNFCMRVLGRRVRFRSPENVLAEIKMLLEDYRASTFTFVENFGLDRRRSEAILDMMLRDLPGKLTWDCSIRVDRMEVDLCRKMKRAGCVAVGFGVESGDELILRNAGKRITIEKAINASKIAKKAGLRTSAFYILGHPNETRETARKTIGLAIKMNTDEVVFGIMVPYPGTDIYRMAVAGEGGYKMVSENWADFNKQMGNALELASLSRRELERLQMMAYIKFYLFNFRFIDLLKHAFTYRRLAWGMLRKILSGSSGKKPTLRRNARP